MSDLQRLIDALPRCLVNGKRYAPLMIRFRREVVRVGYSTHRAGAGKWLHEVQAPTLSQALMDLGSDLAKKGLL